MSLYYASIRGSRGEATRGGTASSGITGHIRGWGNGVQVEGGLSEQDEDVFRVYATSGSHGGSRRLIATVYPDRILHHTGDSVAPLEDLR